MIGQISGHCRSAIASNLSATSFKPASGLDSDCPDIVRIHQFWNSITKVLPEETNINYLRTFTMISENIHLQPEWSTSVVDVDSVNILKFHLDKFWIDQPVMFHWQKT